MRRFAIQVAAYSLNHLRQGKNFREQLNEFKALYSGGEAEFNSWRLERSDSIKKFASEKSQYYHEKDFSLGKKRVSKNDLRENIRSFLTVSSHSPFIQKTKTSGTTGVGLTVFSERSTISTQAAAWWLFRSLYGLEPGERGMVVGGRKIPQKKGQKGSWIFLPGLNQLYVSSFNVSEDTIFEYLSAAEKYKIKWIHGYPSALLPIAELILRKGINLDLSLKLVSTGSESISAFGREMLKKAFDAPVSEFYGQVENVCALWRCPHGVLHDLGVIGDVELDKTQNENVFEIVGSSYWNYAMPLIGYQTGDLISGAVDVCTCGYPYPLGTDLEGRVDDYVLKRDGTSVGRLARIFTHVKGCEEAQLIQHNFGEFEINLGNGGTVDAANFQLALEDMLREKVVLKVNIGNGFVRTKGGKVKSVVRSF